MIIQTRHTTRIAMLEMLDASFRRNCDGVVAAFGPDRLAMRYTELDDDQWEVEAAIPPRLLERAHRWLEDEAEVWRERRGNALFAKRYRAARWLSKQVSAHRWEMFKQRDKLRRMRHRKERLSV